jgi:hypothetical protein
MPAHGHFEFSSVHGDLGAFRSDLADFEDDFRVNLHLGAFGIGSDLQRIGLHLPLFVRADEVELAGRGGHLAWRKNGGGYER